MLVEVPLGGLVCETRPGTAFGVTFAFHDHRGIANLGRGLDQVAPTPVRTAEKVWSRSGGTSVRSCPWPGWAGRPRQTRRRINWPAGLARRPPRSTFTVWRRWSSSSLLMPPLGNEFLAPFEVGLQPAPGSPSCSRRVATLARRLAIWLFTSSDGRLSWNRLALGLMAASALHLGLGRHQVCFRRLHGGLLDRELEPGRVPYRAGPASHPFSRGSCRPQGPGSPGRRPGEPRRSRGR